MSYKTCRGGALMKYCADAERGNYRTLDCSSEEMSKNLSISFCFILKDNSCSAARTNYVQAKKTTIKFRLTV